MVEKPILAQFFKKFPSFNGKVPATGPYPEPDASSPQLQPYFFISVLI
jgi:hypothetical protein